MNLTTESLIHAVAALPLHARELCGWCTGDNRYVLRYRITRPDLNFSLPAQGYLVKYANFEHYMAILKRVTVSPASPQRIPATKVVAELADEENAA